MIVEPVISAAIIDLIKGINSPEDPDTAIKQYADGMAKIIADAIKKVFKCCFMFIFKVQTRQYPVCCL